MRRIPERADRGEFGGKGLTVLRGRENVWGKDTPRKEVGQQRKCGQGRREATEFIKVAPSCFGQPRADPSVRNMSTCQHLAFSSQVPSEN